MEDFDDKSSALTAPDSPLPHSPLAPAPTFLAPSLKTGLLRNPPDLTIWRERLFSVPGGKVVLTTEEYAAYWPYVSNVWRLHSRKKAVPLKGTQTTYFDCRLWRRETAKTQGKGLRDKPIRLASSCGIKLKVIVDLLSGVHSLERQGECAHNHDLASLDAIKKNGVLRAIAGAEIANGYAPAMVSRTLRAPNRPLVEKAFLEAGGRHFGRQDVKNAGRGWTLTNPDDRFVGKNFPWEIQRAEAEDWLSSEGYKVASLVATRRCDGALSQGLLFADEKRLETLRFRGHLTLMDATHDSNWLGWLLYTLMVRDDWGSWIPVAHFLAEKEDGDIIVRCLQELKRWCGGRRGWIPRYFLTDDSATEQRAVRESFRGLEEGETEVTHLLCQFHSEKTIREKLSGDKCRHTREALITALKFRRTETGCIDSIREAYDAAPDAKKEYIKKEWWDTRASWAHYAREHSPLLLQVTTTNPVESWHSGLKTKDVTKSILSRFSLQGVAKHVMATAKDYDLRADERREKFRTRVLPLAQEHPELQRFPYPVQCLLTDEIKAAKRLIEEDEPIRDFLLEDSHGDGRPPVCDCRFFRKWQIPCCHIWQHHILFGSVTTAMLDEWEWMWEDGGYECYETRGTDWVERGFREEIGAPVRCRLDLKELLDGLKSRYYELEATVASMPPEKAAAVMLWWVGKLGGATSVAGQWGLEKFKQELGL
jgi:hypothetical protein